MTVCKCIAIVLGVIAFAVSCSDAEMSNSISTDSITVEKGRQLFAANCATCHQFDRNGIGPALGGVTVKVSKAWLDQFIRNPRSSDSTEQIAMPSFNHWTTENIDAVIAYLNSYKDVAVKNIDGAGIADPIPDKIQLSDYILEIEKVVQFPASSKPGETPRTRITKVAQPPFIAAIFANDLRGKLYKLVNNQPLVYLDVRKNKSQFIDAPGLATGFGSFAFHSDFVNNGLLYTTHTEKPGTAKADFSFEDSLPVEVQWVLTEWKANAPSSNAFSGSNRELLRINMVAGAHGLQEIAFNTSVEKGDSDYGNLYIGVGDGASVQLGFPFVTHGKGRIWGSVLRIDPLGNNSRNKNYGIPVDNPFIRPTKEKSIREVYAYGFRNPHRLSWTSKGQLMVSNIGQANIESIYAVKAGDNCGWPFREGRFTFDPYGDLNQISPPDASDTTEDITYPLVQYDHDEGLAVCGGFEYDGKFVFGDIPSGRLFFFNLADKDPEIKEWRISINGRQTSLKELCGIDRVDLHFGMDNSGSLYILTKADGSLYKIKPPK